LLRSAPRPQKAQRVRVSGDHRRGAAYMDEAAGCIRAIYAGATRWAGSTSRTARKKVVSAAWESSSRRDSCRAVLDYPDVVDVHLYGAPSRMGAPGESDLVVAVVVRTRRHSIRPVCSTTARAFRELRADCEREC